MDKTMHEKTSYLHQKNDIGIYYCGKRENTENHTYGPEIRNHWLFVLVNKGRAVLESHGGIEFGEKDMLIMFPDDRVYYRALTEWSISWVGLYGQTVDETVKRLGITKESPIVHINVYEEIRRIFGEIYNLAEEPVSFEHDLEMINLIYNFFRALFRNRKARGNIDPTDTAIRIMDLNYNTHLSVENMAKTLYLNPIYFSRIFKEKTGMSPKRYILKKRIERAKYLLENTDFAIGEISNSVGYEDALYFSRIFKKAEGCSPKEYREKINSPRGI